MGTRHTMIRARRARVWPAVASGVAITIYPALAEQVRISTNALRSREHLHLHPDLMARLGLDRLRQVRVELATGEIRVMTVEQQYDGPNGALAGHMHADAYARFGVAVGPVAARIYIGAGAAVRSDISDAEARVLGDHVEYVIDNSPGDTCLVFGPHGGDIEYRTDDQAIRCYSQLVALGANVAAWGTAGYSPEGSIQTASDRWHTTMVDLHPSDHPMLATLWTRTFLVGVQFHGYAADSTIEIGGRCGDPVRTACKAALDAALVGLGITVILSTNDNWDGDATRNALNRLVPGDLTLQIEQGYDVRVAHWLLIADTMAAFVYSIVPG